MVTATTPTFPAATQDPPGPSGLSALGVLPRVIRDPYGAFEQLAREYGDVVKVPIPGMPLVLVSHPDHVRQITNTKHATYPKPELFRDIMFREAPRFHGMANGEEWKRVRKMLNPKFTPKGLKPLEELIVGAIVESVDGWGRWADTGETVDIQEELSLVTMSVLLRSMFTRPASEAEIKRLADSYLKITHGMAIAMATTPLPSWVPRPFEGRYDRAKGEVFAHIDAMVAERRREPSIGEGDLLDMVINGEFEDGSKLDDEHIRRELLGLIFGGYETTAAVMSWVFARLPAAPAIQARAYEEVDGLGGARVGLETFDDLVWLRACFDECQRLQGFAVNAREATEDDEIGGYRIPAGTTVAFSGQRLHRDPRWWRDPESFDPRRFIDDKIDTYAFLPFGVGPRRCLGLRMAYMVGLWTLATAFQRYRFQHPAGWKAEPKFLFSSPVKGGVPVRITRRTVV